MASAWASLGCGSRADFIAKNRAVLTDFLEDYLRMMRFYTDPANHDEAALPDPRLQSAYVYPPRCARMSALGHVWTHIAPLTASPR
jgi:hypothetical protein